MSSSSASSPKPKAKIRPPSGGNAVQRLGSRGASYVQASQGRQTAFMLIVAILLARLALTNQLQTF